MSTSTLKWLHRKPKKSDLQRSTLLLRKIWFQLSSSPQKTFIRIPWTWYNVCLWLINFASLLFSFFTRERTHTHVSNGSRPRKEEDFSRDENISNLTTSCRVRMMKHFHFIRLKIWRNEMRLNEATSVPFYRQVRHVHAAEERRDRDRVIELRNKISLFHLWRGAMLSDVNPHEETSAYTVHHVIRANGQCCQLPSNKLEHWARPMSSSVARRIIIN